MFNLLEDLDWAENHTRFAMGQLRNAASHIDSALQNAPEYADQLTGWGAQLWTMESLCREINAAVAKLHSEVRSTP